MFNNVPGQQPDDQLQKQHITQTEIMKYNKQGTYETYTYNKKDRKPKSLNSTPNKITLIFEIDNV